MTAHPKTQACSAKSHFNPPTFLSMMTRLTQNLPTGRSRKQSKTISRIRNVIIVAQRPSNSMGKPWDCFSTIYPVVCKHHLRGLDMTKLRKEKENIKKKYFHDISLSQKFFSPLTLRKRVNSTFCFDRMSQNVRLNRASLALYYSQRWSIVNKRRSSRRSL
jgi:hypothetical protein